MANTDREKASELAATKIAQTAAAEMGLDADSELFLRTYEEALSALREAHNSALEEAADKVWAVALPCDSDFSRGIVEGRNWAGRIIRTLREEPSE